MSIHYVHAGHVPSAAANFEKFQMKVYILGFRIYADTISRHYIIIFCHIKYPNDRETAVTLQNYYFTITI